MSGRPEAEDKKRKVGNGGGRKIFYSDGDSTIGGSGE